MKNVYDILINFKKMPYEFYEWRKEDDIEHIKVMPSFKVSDKCLFDFINSQCSVKNDFLKLMEGKSEIFCNRLIKVIDYACIIFNNDCCLALEFDKQGKVIGKSKLLFDEADDVVTSGIDLPLTKIDYTVEYEIKLPTNYTRRQLNMIKILTKYLDTVFKKNEKDEIKYMYFECFDEIEENEVKAYKKLALYVNNADMNVINKLKSLIKVLKK